MMEALMQTLIDGRETAHRIVAVAQTYATTIGTAVGSPERTESRKEFAMALGNLSSHIGTWRERALKAEALVQQLQAQLQQLKAQLPGHGGDEDTAQTDDRELFKQLLRKSGAPQSVIDLIDNCDIEIVQL